MSILRQIVLLNANLSLDIVQFWILTENQLHFVIYSFCHFYKNINVKNEYLHILAYF